MAPLKKLISNPQHIELFQQSNAYAVLTGFIKTACQDVEGKTVSDVTNHSENVVKMLDLLEKLDNIVTDTPPLKRPSRFGNKAFRKYVSKIEEAASGLLSDAFPNLEHLDEHACYLGNSFGNSTRIDYGSGHELYFICLLCTLSLEAVFVKQDMPSLVLHVFRRYLQLCRRIQTSYNLEPAGSHGVWGLDDHQFLCYYFGASQLIGQDDILPSAIVDENEPARLSQDYLFFEAIAFILQVKTGPFFEHSRYLFDISAVKTWEKVTSGLWKMYLAEVLHKFPVVQHFLFGSLLHMDKPPSPPSDDDASHNKDHPLPLTTRHASDDASETCSLPTSASPSHQQPSNDNDVGVVHDGMKVNTGTKKQEEFTKTWGGPVPKRDTSLPTPFQPSSVPMTGLPGTVPDPFKSGQNEQDLPPPPVGGNARVAERGQLRPRRKTNESS